METFIIYIIIWAVLFGTVYYFAKLEYNSYYSFWMYWKDYKKKNSLGIIYSIMLLITIYVPIIIGIGYLFYLFIKL